MASTKRCFAQDTRGFIFIYQTITIPDGLIFSLYEPEIGRRHDLTRVRESEIEESLDNCLLIN